jgi:hypothetical protein
MSYGSRGPKNQQLFQLIAAGYTLNFWEHSETGETFITIGNDAGKEVELSIGKREHSRTYKQSQMTKKLNIFIKENLDGK